ncbi:MAG: glycosyltransferase family 39 protein [Proteobacteria bacterium]|nr:glycosyltransferase family 39 protein [Pseudomonadota bacterium]
MLATAKSKLSIFTHSSRFDLIWLTAFLGILFFLFLGSYPLFSPDEGRYSEVAREMLATGNFITPHVNGVVFLDKPILFYWLQAFSIKLFGLNEWAIRLWPALFGIFGCLLTYLAGRKLYDRRTGLLSALILASAPLYFGAAHYANLDLEVAVLISAALFCSLMAFHSESKRETSILFILAYVFAGFATLTKGMMGIVFPMMIIGSWILITNRWRMILHMRLFSGLLVFLLITLPWFLLVQKETPQFFHFFFITQQASRFLTADTFNNKTHLWFYLPIVLLGFFPWVFFLCQAFLQKLKMVFGAFRTSSVELFLLLWIFLIFIFFSIPGSKIPGYILPIFPPIALLIGNFISTYWDDLPKPSGIKTGTIIYSLFSFSLAILCFSVTKISMIKIPEGLLPAIYIIGSALFISCVFSLFLYKKKFAASFLLLFFTIIFCLLTAVKSLPIINQKSIKPFATYLKKIIKPNDEVVTFYNYYQDLPIYLERRITIVYKWDDPNIPNKDTFEREFWYSMPYQDTHEWLIMDKTFLERWHSKKRLFVFLYKDDVRDFENNVHSKTYHLKQNGRIFLVSNQPEN